MCACVPHKYQGRLRLEERRFRRQQTKFPIRRCIFRLSEKNSHTENGADRESRQAKCIGPRSRPPSPLSEVICSQRVGAGRSADSPFSHPLLNFLWSYFGRADKLIAYKSLGDPSRQNLCIESHPQIRTFLGTAVFTTEHAEVQQSRLCTHSRQGTELANKSPRTLFVRTSCVVNLSRCFRFRPATPWCFRLLSI